MTDELFLVRSPSTYTETIYDADGELVGHREQPRPAVDVNYWVESGERCEHLVVSSEEQGLEAIEMLQDGELDSFEEAASEFSEAAVR
jgi:hypothetical protein